MNRNSHPDTGNTARRSAALVAVAVIAVTCKGHDPATSRLRDALKDCDHGPTCSAALAEVRSLPPEAATSPGGVEVRRLALRIGLQAAAAFPPPDPATFRVPPVADLAREAEALGDPGAITIASFLARPLCEVFQNTLALVESGGPYAEPALTAGIQALAQVLAAITPDRASEFARAARDLIGCTLSERASSTAVLVQARNLLYDLTDRCGRAPLSNPVARASCQAARELLSQRTLPLPWPDAAAGDLLFTTPPRSLRGTGLHGTPPFAVVLAAGRLGVYDQPVLGPGVRATPETRVDWVVDLRERHVPDDVALALKRALDRRKPVPFGEAQVVFFVVDRATPASEMFEVLLALTAISDATAAVAMTVPGRSDPVFLPVNYWISDRILMDPTGRAVAFGRGEAMVVGLQPFRAEVALHGRTEVVDLPTGGPTDLRPLYRATRSLIGEDTVVSARILTDGPVPVGLLTAVIEVLSFQVPDAGLESPGAFGSVFPLRDPDGRPSPLCSVIVVGPTD